MQDISPNIYGVVESAAEIKRTFQRSKVSQNQITQAIESNRYIKMGRTAFSNAMKDLASGNFDNSSRSMDSGNDESTSYNFGEIEDGDGSTGQIQTVVNFNPEGLNSINQSITKQTKFQVQAAKANVDAIVATSSAMMTMNQRNAEASLNMLSNINNSLQAIVKYNNENMSKYITASMAYYELMGKAYASKEATSRGNQRLFGTDIIDGKGNLSASNISKLLKQNFKDRYAESSMGQITGALDSFGDVLVTNPLKILTTQLMTSVIPKAVKDATASLDKTFGSFITEMLMRSSETLKASSGKFSGLRQFLGNVLDINVDRTERFNTANKVTTDAAVFDGITRNAITAEIPKYLRESTEYLRQLVMLNGGDPDKAIANSQIFNRKKGIFERYGDFSKNLLGSIEESVIDSLARSDFGKSLQKIADNSNLIGDQKDAYEKLIKNFYLAIEKDNRSVIDITKRGPDSDIAKIIGTLSGDPNLKQILERNVYATFAPGRGGMNFNSARLHAKASRNKRIAELEENNLIDISGINQEGKSIEEVMASVVFGNDGHATQTYNYAPSSMMGKISDIRSILERGINVHVLKNSKAFGPFTPGSAANTPKDIENSDARPVSDTSGNAKDVSKMSTAEIDAEIEKSYSDQGSSDGNKKERGKFFANKATHLNNILHHVVRGDTTAVYSEMISMFGEGVGDLGHKLNDSVVTPLKDTIFGKDKDGKSISIASKVKEMFTGVKKDIKSFVLGDDENKTGEKRKESVKSFISEGLQGWSNALFGPDKSFKDVKEELTKKIQKNSDAGLKGALIGGGLGISAGGILGSLVGGPLTGALLGTATGFLSRSEGFQKMVFGDMVDEIDPETGEPTGKKVRDGGIISKDVRDYFKKNKSSFVGSGTIGAIGGAVTGGGLLGSLVGGPIAGALIGTGVSMVSKSKAFNEFIYGKETDKLDENGQKRRIGGILNSFNKIFKNNSSDSSEKSNAKSVASMTTIGTGAGLLASFFTPLGPIGGAALGLATSMFASKDKFHDMLFGSKEDQEKDGNHGLVNKLGAVVNNVVLKPIGQHAKDFVEDAKDAVVDKLLDPLENFLGPMMGWAKSIQDRIGDKIDDVFGSLKDGFKTVTKNLAGAVGTGFSRLMKMLFGERAKKLKDKITSIPGAILNKAGDHIRKKNEKRSLARWNSDKFRNDPRNKGIFDQVQQQWDEMSDDDRKTYGGDFQNFSDSVGRKFFYNAEDTRAAKLQDREKRAKERTQRRSESKRLNDQGALIALLTGGEFSDVNEDTKAKALEAFKRSKAYAKGKGKGGFSNEQILDLLSPDAKLSEQQEEGNATAKENLDVSWKQLNTLEKIEMMLSDLVHLPGTALKVSGRAIGNKWSQHKEKSLQNKIEYYTNEASISNFATSLRESSDGNIFMDGFTMSKKDTKQMESMARYNDEYGDVAKRSLEIINDPNSTNDERKQALKDFKDAKQALKDAKINNRAEHNKRVGDYKASRNAVITGSKITGGRGYATGTGNAKPGDAVVGENGPEIVRFKGGEKVLSNNDLLKVRIVSVDPNAAKAMNDNGTQDVNIIGQTGPIVTYGTAAKLDHNTDNKSQIQKALAKKDTLVSYDQIKADNNDMEESSGKVKDESLWDKIKDSLGSLGKILLGGGAIAALLKVLQSDKVQAAIEALGGMASDTAENITFTADNNAYEGGTDAATNTKNQISRIASIFTNPKKFLLGADGEADAITGSALRVGRTGLNTLLNGKPASSGLWGALRHPVSTAKNAIMHPFKTLGSIGTGVKNVITHPIQSLNGGVSSIVNPIKSKFSTAKTQFGAAKDITKTLFGEGTWKEKMSSIGQTIRNANDATNPNKKGLSGWLTRTSDKLKSFGAEALDEVDIQEQLLHIGDDVTEKAAKEGTEAATKKGFLSSARELVEKFAKYGASEGLEETGEAAAEKAIKAAATKTAKEGAESIATEAAEKTMKTTVLQSLSKVLKEGIEKICETVGKSAGGKKAVKIASSVLNVVDDVIEKITKGLAGKMKSWIMKKLSAIAAKLGISTGFVATGVGAIALLVKDGAFFIIGALNSSGKGGTARLFRCKQEDVDWKMRLISSAIGACVETTFGSVVDIVNEIYCAVSGDDFICNFASMIYKAISNAEDDAKLTNSQNRLKDDYKAYQEKFYAESYNAYKEENPDTTLSLEDYKKKIQTGEIETDMQGFAEYNDNQNKTVGAKVWGGVKSATSSVGNGIKSAWNFVTGKGNKDSGSGGKGGFGSAVPYYSQKDPRWGRMSYEQGGAGETMANAGCGPTAFAMAASGATGRNIDPVQSASMMKHVGARDHTGTNWSGIGRAANMYGISTRMQQNPSTGFVDSELDAGNPVILSGRAGGYGNTPYTSQGHYVVATGRDSSGNYIINDPNKIGGPRKYKKSDMIAETGAAWGFGGRGPQTRMAVIEDGSAVSKTNQTSDIDARAKWLSIVRAVKKALADLKVGYSQSRWVTITIGGKSLKVRTDCSGFVTACLKFFGVLGDDVNMSSYNYASGTTSNLLKAGFSSKNWSSWNDLKEGDIIAKNGHVEIFAGNASNSDHYVYNCGSDSSCNNPNATKTGYPNGYQMVWTPGAPGTGVVNAINISGDASVTGTSTTDSSSSTSSGGGFFSKLTTFFSELGSRAVEGLTTGKWNTDWSGVFGTSSSSNDATVTTSTNESLDGTSTVVADGSVKGNTSVEKIWNLLKSHGMTDAGAAGALGNLFAESGVRTNNVQNSYESRVGSDEAYTAKVDNGTYTNFAKDGAGYGLAQWTYHTRKQALLDLARRMGRSIADEEVQTTHMMNELSQSYKDVYAGLKSATNVKGASDLFMTKYESPADQSAAAKAKRASYAQAYYDQYANTGGYGGFGDDTSTVSTGVKNAIYQNRLVKDPISDSTNSEIIEYLRSIVTLLEGSSSKLDNLQELKKLTNSQGSSVTNNRFYTQNNSNTTSTGKVEPQASKTNPDKMAKAMKLARGGL